MKFAATVFIWLAIIYGMLAVVPTVFGIIALVKMGNGTMTTGWKIATLLLVSPIAGILLLCDKD
ncbi:MAG: hypothetical protein IKT46_03840 [Clostridia bacterium]|nr:hypothetical protein [Clostridia bacterium]